MLRLTLIIFLLTLTRSYAEELKIICKEKAQQGSPVSITATGIPENAQVKWVYFPAISNQEQDTLLELYDRNNNPVNVFWSSRSITLFIVLITGPDLNVATHTLQYGDSPNPNPAPYPNPPRPDAELIKLTEPLSKFSISRQDRLTISEFYYDFYIVISLDAANKHIKTTEIFRNSYMNAGQLMFQQSGLEGKYDGLAEAIDSVIVSYLGLDIVPLEHGKAAKVLCAIAWRIYNE